MTCDGDDDGTNDRGALAFLLVVVAAVTACAPDVGLPCETDVNCPAGAPVCAAGKCALAAEGEGEGEGEPDGCGATTTLLVAREVAVGFSRSCVVTCDDTVVCWGEYEDTLPPAGRLHGVTVGQHAACALDDDSVPQCWGPNLDDTDEVPTDADGAPIPMRSIAAGQSHVCGLAADNGALRCWGNTDYGGTFEIPSGAYDAVAAGWAFVCARRVDDGLTDCGGGTSFVPAPPAVTLDDVGIGVPFGCGIDDAGLLVCFGDEGPEPNVLPEDVVVRVGVGSGCACAIRAGDRALVCFGDEASCPEVLDDVPAGRFRDVVVASKHACAIREDDAVMCWGEDAWGRASVPAR